MNATRTLLAGLIATTFSLAAAAPATAGTLGTFTSDVNGFDTHTYWYDDGREVTVIDTQFVPALTQAMVEKIRASTRSPITRVIVTHPNPDKFNGLPLLHKLGAESIASQATADAMRGVHDYKKYFWVNIAKAFTEASYPAFEPVRRTFTGRQTVTLKSGDTLTLIQLQHAGVASTQTVVRIDRSGDLIVGDLVHFNAHAWLEGGIVDGKPRPDLSAWRAALAELPALTPQPARARVYGGRGDSGTVDEVVAFQREYLTRAEALVKAYIASQPAAALKDPTRQAEHHKALQAAFEKAMPAARLSYLVGYGVYGLLGSLLP